jgi:hypothetical protein
MEPVFAMDPVFLIPKHDRVVILLSAAIVRLF